MEKSKYDRATCYLKSMEHIDELLSFVHDALDSGDSLLLSRMKSGKSILFESADHTMLIQALERDKTELEEAFEAL